MKRSLQSIVSGARDPNGDHTSSISRRIQTATGETRLHRADKFPLACPIADLHELQLRVTKRQPPTGGKRQQPANCGQSRCRNACREADASKGREMACYDPAGEE